MGFDLQTFTSIHTLVSLVAIAAGIVVVNDLLRATPSAAMTNLFLATSIFTSASGFGFPFTTLLPSHIVGAVALLVLAVVLVARFLRPAPRVEAAGLIASLYFLVFVAVAQAFVKFPTLQAAAPTQSEPPFAIVQLAVLLLFVAIGYRVLRRPLRLA